MDQTQHPTSAQAANRGIKQKRYSADLAAVGESVARESLKSKIRDVRDITLLCWALCLPLLIVPECLGIYNHVQSGQLRRIPDISFVFFYGMGKIFNEYPPERAYDYALQKKVESDLHTLKTGSYGPNPYSPLIGVLFRPFARMSFSSAMLLWVLISLLLYVCGILLFTAHFFPHDLLARSLILCLALAYWPFMHFLSTGQIAMIGFFAVALAFSEELRDRHLLSGLALSICLYKPTLLLLFLPMLLLTRRYRNLIGFVLGALIQAVVVTAVEGPAIWPGYFRLLLSFGSAATARTQQAFTIHSTYYVDLVSFFAIFPGGHSRPARIILVTLAASVAFALIRTWWKARGKEGNIRTLIWATTICWTAVLNTYVGVWDTTPMILSIVATIMVVRTFADKGLSRLVTMLGISILACSYVSVAIAEAAGIQILTILFAALGILQQVIIQRATSPRSNEVDIHTSQQAIPEVCV